MSSMPDNPFRDLVRRQKAGESVGLPSMCSANRFVLEAAMLQARRDDSPVLIESTSNQVDQFGGYTGMTPADFVHFVAEIADGLAFPRERLLLGGDHLGPNRWRNESAEQAMAKARDLVDSYVRAGFSKIHLDASMHCAGDPGDRSLPLADEIVAERAADLCAVAESATREAPAGTAPAYVIGTEVPVPGGAQEDLQAAPPTRVEDAARTIEVTRRAFLSRDLGAAWERVIAVVVQPGVEYGDHSVIEYDRDKAGALSRHIESYDGLVYEAHSTDYQTAPALRQMVADHFAVLKVGPWLTFAFREAIFALADMEREWLGARRGVTLSAAPETLERVMVARPAHWRKHYHGDEAALRYARKYSYSDRSRYYWPDPDVQAALQRLLANLDENRPPLTLVSQCMPNQYHAVRRGEISTAPVDLIRSKVMEVTGAYSCACGLGEGAVKCRTGNAEG